MGKQGQTDEDIQELQGIEHQAKQHDVSALHMSALGMLMGHVHGAGHLAWRGDTTGLRMAPACVCEPSVAHCCRTRALIVT